MACNGYTSDARKKHLESTSNGRTFSVLEVGATSEAMTHDPSNGGFPIFFNDLEFQWKDKPEHFDFTAIKLVSHNICPGNNGQ